MRKIKEISIRVLRLILVFAMIALIIPMNIVASAEDEDPESAIGSVVCFVEDTFYMYKEAGSGANGYNKDEFPEYLVIVDVAEKPYGAVNRVYYQLGTMDGLEHPILSTHSWILSTDVTIVEIPVNKEGMIEGQVGLVVDGKSVSEITVERGKKRYVSTSLGKLVVGTPTYQWQLLIDKANNRWADISGYSQPYATISEALLINAFDEEGKATVRCVATAGKNKYVSDNMVVTMVEPTAGSDQGISYKNGHIQGLPPLQSAVKLLKEPLQEPRAVDAFKVAVSYTYRHASAAPLSKIDGSIAAPAFAASLPIGGHYTGDVFSTPVIGYLPYVLEEQKNFILLGEGETIKDVPKIEYDGATYYLAHALDFNEVTQETDIHVYYIPQEVNFMVKIYEQNLHNDEYVLAETVLESGLSDAAVGTGHDQPRTGFSPLYYDPEIPINGEGTTEVEIYYDRNYYLVDFDLDPNDEGNDAYGATPYYVRYNTPVALPEPINPGYTFTGWNLESVYTIEYKIEEGEEKEEKKEVEDATIRDRYDQKVANTLITVQHNVDYLANWSASTTSYTVIYWRENENDNEFSIWKTETVTGVTAGSVVDVSGRDISATLATTDGVNEKRFFTRNDALSDKTVTVKGDGTSAANIYYNRNVYYIIFRGTTDQGATQCRIAHSHGTNCCSVEGCMHINPTLCKLEPACGFVHVHNANCTLICGKEEHLWHDNDCQITCGEVEHQTHAPSCYGLANNAQTSDPGMFAPTNNLQDGQIYRRAINGNKYIYINGSWYRYNGDEGDGAVLSSTCHKHTNGCYEDVLHAHTDDCYTNCEGHEHDESCGKQACIRYEHTCDGNCSRYLYAIAAKYNADIAKAWPTATHVDAWREAGWLNSNVYYQYWSGSGSWATKRVDMTSELCSTNTNRTLTLTLVSANSQGKNTVRYMFESIDQANPGSGAEQYGSGSNRRWYEEDSRYTQKGLTAGSFDPKEILGMDSVNSGSLTLYYNRNSYNLVFMNGGATDKTVSLKYETPLQSQYYVPNLPSWYEANSVEFAGWYTTQMCADGTEFNFTASDIMPAYNMYLYAKWTPCYYTAKVYLDSEKGVQLGETQTLVFNSQIVEPDYKAAQAGNEEYKNLIFAGWYYMDGATEKRFDFNTMVLKGNIEIYAKWTSHVPVDYTIYYVVQDDSGDLTYEGKKYKSIAEPIRGQSLAGITKSFTAKVQTELHDGFQKWYFPDKRTGSILMSDNEEENNYYFIYSLPTEVSYSVVHKFVSEDFVDELGSNTLTMTHVKTIGGDDIQEHPAAITIEFRAYITEENIKKAAIAQNNSLSGDKAKLDQIWSIVTGSSPDHYEQTLILEAYGTNEVVFNWKGTTTISTYQVIHYFETDQLGHYVADYTQSFVGNIDDTVTAAPIEYKGFALNEAQSVKSGTITKLVFSASGVTGELVLKLYYDRETYNYTVYHYKYGTTESLLDPETSSAKFETVVSVASLKKSIEGYAIANESTQYEITDEGQSIVCYYKGLQVIYNYQVLGFAHGGSFSLAQAVALVGETPKESVFTLNAGYFLTGWSYVVDGESTEIPDSWKKTVDGKTVIQPGVVPVEWANKTVTIYAEVAPTSLTIQNSGQFGDEHQAIIYEVRDSANNLLLTVAVVGSNGSVTILGLPSDATYTITVKDDWSWEYKGPADAPTQIQMQTIPSFNGDEALTFVFQGMENNPVIADDAYGE